MTKPDSKKCRTKFCRGKAHRSGKSPYCSKCRTRRWRDKHPIKYHFHKLRSRARERGHEFRLTLFDYACFWFSTGYGVLRGKTALSLSINRIDNSKGYIPGNIEAITLSENSRRQFVPYFKEDIAAVEKQLSQMTDHDRQMAYK